MTEVSTWLPILSSWPKHSHLQASIKRMFGWLPTCPAIREEISVERSYDGTIEFFVEEFRDHEATWQQRRIS